MNPLFDPQRIGFPGIMQDGRRYAPMAPGSMLQRSLTERAPLKPGEFIDPRTGAKVVGLQTEQQKGNFLRAVGGNTWAGNPMGPGGEVFTGQGGSFGMGGGAPPGSTIGGVAHAPDMFGAAFDPFEQNARRNEAAGIGFNKGGDIVGPGGPMDDMVPAMVDGVKPINVSNGERIVPAPTRDWFGEKFFVDLDEKARKGRMEMNMPDMKGGKPGYADGGTPGFMERQGQELRKDWEFAKDRAGMVGSALAAPWQWAGQAMDAINTARGDLVRGFNPPTPAPPPAPAAPQFSRAPTDYSGLWGGIDASLAPAPTAPGGPLASIQPPARPFMQTSPLQPDPMNPMAPPAFQPAPMATGQIPPMNPAGMIPAAPAPTIEDMKFRGLAARAALDNASLASPQSPPLSGLVAPWEKDAMRHEALVAGNLPGMNRTQTRRALASPQLQGVIMQEQGRATENKMQRQDKQEERQREDERNRVRDQQWAAQEKRLSAAGATEAELARARLGFDAARLQMDAQDAERKNRVPELRAVETPDGRGVVYYSGNQLASGVMPTGKQAAAVLTREQMDALDVDVDRVVDGKISYKKRATKEPRIQSDNMGGFFRYENGQMVPVPQAVPGAAAPAAQANITPDAYAKLKPGDSFFWNGQMMTKK